jgi:hypothetical protein
VFGHEIELGLRPVIEALAEELPAPDGDLRLVEVPAGSLRIGLGIEKDQQPRLLERFEDRI